jgi:hypothetical protein
MIGKLKSLGSIHWATYSVDEVSTTSAICVDSKVDEDIAIILDNM